VSAPGHSLQEGDVRGFHPMATKSQANGKILTDDITIDDPSPYRLGQASR